MEAGRSGDHDGVGMSLFFADTLGNKITCLTWSLRPSLGLKTPLSKARADFLSSDSDLNMSQSLANQPIPGQ